MSDGGYDREHDAMYKEEEKLRKQSEREGKRERERDQEKWKKNAGDKNYLKDLDWFLNRSQVRICPCDPCSGMKIRPFSGIDIISELFFHYHGPTQAGFGSKKRSNDKPAGTSDRR